MFRELLKLIGENGGKLPYGSTGKLIKEYKGNEFKAVTRQNLYFGLKTHEKQHGNRQFSSKLSLFLESILQ